MNTCKPKSWMKCSLHQLDEYLQTKVMGEVFIAPVGRIPANQSHGWSVHCTSWTNTCKPKSWMKCSLHQLGKYLQTKVRDEVFIAPVGRIPANQSHGLSVHCTSWMNTCKPKSWIKCLLHQLDKYLQTKVMD